MKKRVLSVLLVIALLVAVGIVAAQANETDPTPAEIYAEAQTVISAAQAMTFEEGAIPTTCPKCGEDVTWRPVTNESAATAKSYWGHYYLAEDIKTDRTGIVMLAEGNLCLHLNGHTITSTDEAGSFNTVIRGGAQYIVNIYDNAEGTGGVDGGTIHCALQPANGTGGVMNIYGGTYSSTEKNGIVFDIRAGDTMNFFAGATDSNMIRVNSGTFNGFGGTVGGTQIRCTSGAGYVNLHEDVVVNATNGVNMYSMNLVMDGGHLNKITYATGTSQSLSISGDAVIDDLSGLKSNGVKATFGVLTEGASIGFGTYTGVISTAYETEAEAKAVADSFPVAVGKEVTVNDDLTLNYGKRTTPYTPAEIIANSNAMTFTGNAAGDAGYCYACMKDVTWMPLNALTDTTGCYTSITGHYYVAEDITSSSSNGTIYGNVTGALCLHMNNKTITNSLGTPAIRVWGTTLNLMGEGTLVGGNTGWGALDVHAGATNVYGGTFQARGDTYFAINCQSQTTTFYAGSISKGLFNIKSRDVNRNTVVNINGGTFEGTINVQDEVATTGNGHVTVNVNAGTLGTLNAANDVYVNGGTVANLVGGANADLIQISGAPTVGAVNLTASAVKLTVGELTTGASIGLGTTSGVFTTAFADETAAEAAMAYFTAEPGMAVTVTDDFKLTYGTKTYTPAEVVELSAKQVFEGTDPVEAFCYACGAKKTWKPLTGPDKVYQGNMQSHNHWFIANDIKEDAVSGTFYFASYGSQQTWCLHLNGKTIENTVKDGVGIIPTVIRQHNSQCIVNVMGSGKLINHGNVWGAISVAGGVNTTTGKAAGVNVYGGELYNDGENTWALTANGGYVNVYGGSIPSGAINVAAAEVNLYDADYKHVNLNSTGTLTIHDGNYTNVRVYNTGEVNINGGTVSQLIANDKAGTIKLAGAPTVGAISLAEGKVLDLTGMTGGSLNVGSYEGVFTTAFADADAAAAAAKFVTSPSKAIDVTEAFALTTADAAAAVVNGNTQKAYKSYADAEAACTDGYVKLFGNNNVEITKDVTIDFNGNSVDVTGTGVLTGMDNATKGNFSKMPGEISIADTITVQVPELETEGTLVKGYLPVTVDGLTTFSYYEMKLSGVALKANTESVGMYYKGIWSFNDYLRGDSVKDLVEAGVVVSLVDMPDANFASENTAETTVNYNFGRNPADITNGEAMTSVLVEGIMKSDRDAADNTTYGKELPIYACAYVTVNGEETVVTGGKVLSVADLLTAIENSETAYEANKDKLNNFYTAWASYVDFASWNLPKYGKES